MKTLKTLLMTLCLAGAVHAEAKTVTLNFRSGLSTSSVSAERTLTLANPEALATLDVGDTLNFEEFALVLTARERAGTSGGWRAKIGEDECAVVYRGTKGWRIEITDRAKGVFHRLRQVEGARWVSTREDTTRGAHHCDGPREWKGEIAVEGRGGNALSLSTSSADGDKLRYIDILFAFDGNAKKYVESEINMTLDDFAYGQLAKMNAVLKNEKMDEKFVFRYAGTVSVDNTAKNVDEGLDAVTSGTGGWEKIRDAREAYGADCTCLMIDFGTAYGTVGLAWGLTSVEEGSVIGFSEHAFECVAVRAADWYDTALHEVGHSLGAGHADTMESGAGPQSTPYSSGYYFAGDDSVEYYTIMAYNYNKGKYYTQAPYFSSPDFTYHGKAVGMKDKNDNVRTIRESTDYAWKWRQEKRSVFGPSAEWSTNEFVQGSGAYGFTLDLNGNKVDESGAVVLGANPIFIDTPLDFDSEANGHEITVVMELDGVDTSKAGTIVSFNIGGDDDYYANHAGLGFADGGSVSGIYKGAWPWTDWKDFTTYPSDKAAHRLAFACAWTDSQDPGSGGYYGAQMALDGKIVGACDKMGDSEKEIVKRVAVGGRNGTTPQALVGARVLSLAVYSGALSPKRLRVATGGDIEVGPFMTVNWHQHAPFNYFAPVIGGDADVPCGCAATAAVQMFKHYAWPMRTEEVFYGDAHYYQGNGKYLFPIALDGHNDFQWAKMQDNASKNDVVGNYEAARATLWCDAMARMDFRSGDSSALIDDIAENAANWYEKGNSVYFSMGQNRDAFYGALTNALNSGELVQLTFYTHQVVADGYKMDDDVLSVHLNYGHAGSDTRWYKQSELEGLGLNYLWAGLVPKKTAQVKPLARQTKSSGVKLEWEVPACYADSITGFDIMAYTRDNSAGLLDKFTGDAGLISPDRAGHYYQRGVETLTKDSSITYTMTSYNTRDVAVALQARFDAGEWVTIDTPPLSTKEDDEKSGEKGEIAYTNTVSLAQYAGQGAEFRFKATRSGRMTTATERISYGAPVVKKVYPSGAMSLPSQKAEARSYAFNLGSSFDDNVMAFTVTPKMKGAAPLVSEPVSTVLQSSVAALPAIASIDCMSSSITDGFRRTCAVGKSVFFVKGNETVSDITAASSHIALVGTNGAVKVTKADKDTWAVAIDATGVPNKSQLILTIAVADDLGNKTYKDLQIAFTTSGVEQEDTVAEVIEQKSFVYVGKDKFEMLDYKTESRMIIGWGEIKFYGGVPETTCGLNDNRSWFGRADFEIDNPTEEQVGFLNYIAAQNTAASFYLNGEKIGDKPDPDEMYHNTLSLKDEDIKVMRGKYGADIEVPPVGYYATAFDAKTTLEKSGTGIGGSYADIIIKNGGDNDTRQHTFAGWFCASDLSAERILWFAYANNTIGMADNGYKVCVTTEGKIKIIKTSKDAQDNGTAIYSADAVMTAGKWAHIAVAFEWGGGGQDNRWLKPTLFVNGVQQELSSSTATIGSNLNGDTGAIVQIGADVTAAGVYVGKTTISEGAKVVSIATNACYVVKGQKEMPAPPAPGADLYWNGNAWTNAAGAVMTPVAESVLHTKEGDVVPYTSAVVGTFDGAGTVKLSNANASTSSALSKWVTNENFSATFSGALWLAKGRFEASAPVSKNVAIKVTDGAQLSANGSEWSNHFVLSGDGWDGEAHYDFSHCALRVEAPLGTAATLEFVKEGDVVPAIGAYNAERNIKATLVGEDGFRVMGGGTMKFTEPKTQAAKLKGTIEIVRGTARFGEGQYSNHPTFTFGDKIVVNKGATFFLHCNKESIVTPSTTDKVAFATVLDLNGGTLHMEDGSYVFTKDVTVLADSTMVFKWRKGRVFQSLKGDAVLTVQGTCNTDSSEADGYAVFAGGDFSGTIRSTANATKAVNLYVVPLGEALKAATVDLVAQGKLRLTEDATIGALSGTKPIIVTNDGKENIHTLTIAKGATLAADTATSALVSEAKLVLDGAAITVTDAGTATCRLATAPTISAKGATLTSAGWKLVIERVGEQDVLKAVPLAPFLFFVK